MPKLGADPNFLCVIHGPTAVGKSSLAVEWALMLGAEIISADSMQVYRGMDIGTGKLTIPERRGVPHHLLDVAEPTENYSVANFLRDATPILSDLLARGIPVLVVGGTGYYVRALIDGIVPGPPPDYRLRRRLAEEARLRPEGWLRDELRKVDPERAEVLHPHDEKRLIRALEFFQATGVPMSAAARRTSAPEWSGRAVRLGLTCDWRVLDERIERRVDAMLARGLVEEVRALLSRGCGPQHTAMQAIGYKEMVEHLAGRKSLSETRGEIIRKSRRYARRQMTWLRPDKRIRWMDAADASLRNPLRLLQEKS